MNWKDKIEELKLNAITIGFDEDKSNALPIGVSKFGGCPDLPKDFQWYYFRGESPFTDEVKDRPLSFIAQINCAEVREYDRDRRLPRTGILYFFYELETMVWGFDPEDKGSAKVYYYDGDISELVRTGFPKDMEKYFKLPEIKLSFGSQNNAPSFEELFNEYLSNSWEEYGEFLKKSGYIINEENSSKLLGYADTIQGDMLLQCELVTNGLYCGDSTGYNSPERKELERNKDQWKLLFQLDTVRAEGFELMFGDCGRIYFYIKEEELKNKKFDNIWLILQCS